MYKEIHPPFVNLASMPCKKLHAVLVVRISCTSIVLHHTIRMYYYDDIEQDRARVAQQHDRDRMPSMSCHQHIGSIGNVTNVTTCKVKSFRWITKIRHYPTLPSCTPMYWPARLAIDMYQQVDWLYACTNMYVITGRCTFKGGQHGQRQGVYAGTSPPAMQNGINIISPLYQHAIDSKDHVPCTNAPARPAFLPCFCFIFRTSQPAPFSFL